MLTIDERMIAALYVAANSDGGDATDAQPIVTYQKKQIFCIDIETLNKKEDEKD